MSDVLVTGGTGFIGSHLIEKLLEENFNVYALVRNKNNLKWLKGINCKLIEGDLLNLPEIPEVEYIFHLAGVVRAVKGETYYKINTEGTINLFEKAKRLKGLKRFIFVSTQASSGPGKDKKEEDEKNPISSYGLSKLIAEEYIKKDKSIPWTILKPAAVYGPKDKDFYEFFKLIKLGLFLKPSGGERYLNLVYVEDLVRAIIEASINENCLFKEYFIGYPEPVGWSKFAYKSAKILNKKIIEIKIPFFLLKIAGLFNDFLSIIKRKPAKLNSDKVKEMEPLYWIMDTSKFIKDTGFQYKINLKTGLEKTINWYLKEGWL